jgi:hypothetical protein
MAPKTWIEAQAIPALPATPQVPALPRVPASPRIPAYPRTPNPQYFALCECCRNSAAACEKCPQTR